MKKPIGASMPIWIAIFGLLLSQVSAAAGGKDYGGSIFTGADAGRVAYCKSMDGWVRPADGVPDPNAPQMYIQVNQDDKDETVDVTVMQGDQIVSSRTYDTSTGTGVPSFDDNGNLTETITYEGSFNVTYMDRDHKSGQFGNKGPDGKVDPEQGAPMYNAIFFNAGEALHGTLKSNYKHLGRPASHGCVRLTREQSAELYQKVCEIGPLNVHIEVNGAVTPSKSSAPTLETLSPQAAKAIREGTPGLY